MITMTAGLLALTILPVQAEGETPTPTPETAASAAPAITVSAQGAALMDATSGKVLFEQSGDAHLDPASLTKLMSVYLAATSLDSQAEITMSSTAFQTYDHSSGVLWIQDGETMTAEEAEYASLLASANDTTAMLAEAVSGDQDTFVTKMNETAASLKMSNTNFQNVFGLNNENNYSSAKDMALLVQAAVKNDAFRTMLGSTGYVMAATNMTQQRPIGNDCQFLPGETSAYADATGCKIGSTQAGGYALAATARRDETSLIAVVLGEADAASAYADAAKMLDWGYANYHTVTLKGADVGSKTVEIYSGKTHTYDVVFSIDSDFSILLPAAITKDQITTSIETQHEDLSDPNKVTADVVFSIDGQQVGTIPMKAEIKAIDNSFEATKAPLIQQWFDYGCVGILALVTIRAIASRIAPPQE